MLRCVDSPGNLWLILPLVVRFGSETRVNVRVAYNRRCNHGVTAVAEDSRTADTISVSACQFIRVQLVKFFERVVSSLAPPYHRPSALLFLHFFPLPTLPAVERLPSNPSEESSECCEFTATPERARPQAHFAAFEAKICAFIFLTTREASWYIIMVVSVCLYVSMLVRMSVCMYVCLSVRR